MRPEFASAVDPIMLAALELEHRIQTNCPVIPADERVELEKKIDDAEERLGAGAEWQLAKYAICAWIDARLIEAPWIGAQWWQNNSLEVKYFGRREASTDFFRRAIDAQGLPRFDCLEVFHTAVVLGFRGFYAQRDSKVLAKALRLPPSIEQWSQKVIQHLQQRPPRTTIPDYPLPPDRKSDQTARHRTAIAIYISCILLAIACTSALAASAIAWRGQGKTQAVNSTTTNSTTMNSTTMNSTTRGEP